MRSAPSPRSGSRGRRRVSVPRLPALAFFALLACFAASSAMGAEILSEKELKPLIKEWALSLELVTHKLESGSVSELDLELLHRELTRVRAVALEVGAAAHARLAETTALLETLGPPPAEGAPAESKEIVAERKRLHDELSRISAQAKQAELMVFRAETLLGQLGTARRAGIAQALVTRGPSLFAIDTWEIAGGELVPTLGVIVTSPVVWWESEEVESRRGVGYFALLFVVPILAMALGWLTRVWLSRRFGRDPTIPHPPYYRRLGAAITEGVAHGLVPTLTVLSPYLVFLAYGLLFGPFAEVVRAAVVAVSVFSLTTAMIGAVFAPGQPDWRLAPFDDRASRGLGMRLILLTGVVNIDLFLGLATAVIVLGIGLLDRLPNHATDLVLLLRQQPQRWHLLMSILAMMIGWRCFRAVIEPIPARVQMAVKHCILSLVILDAADCYAARGTSWAVMILLLMVPAMFLGRWIYST